MNQGAHHYATLFSFLLLSPLGPKYPPHPLILKHPPLNVLPLIYKAKFHIHLIRQIKLWFCVF